MWVGGGGNWEKGKGVVRKKDWTKCVGGGGGGRERGVHQIKQNSVFK